MITGLADIKSMDINELELFLGKLGQPSFRAKQIFDWLHKKAVTDFSQMRNLPKALLEKLSETAYITTLSEEKKLISQIDGTTKYLFGLPDGELVEAVVMKYNHGNSICVSTQVGCKMGCSFCASTKAGFVRSLTPSEILEQIYFAERNSDEKISSVVLMGIGEPLDNFDNVLKFMRLLEAEAGRNMSLRHVSLSTCGIVPKINELKKLKLGVTLSISLHAPNDQIRKKTMPIAQKYSIEELISACRAYSTETGRRVSFEYALINGINDSAENAAELAERLKGMLCHVNLIPVNEISETDYKKTDKQRVYAFQQMLIKRGINATVRRTLGADINAACGQLRRENA